MTSRRALREMFAAPPIVVLPGAPDAITAKLVERAGFGAVYLTGAGFANASFGLPDIGLPSVTDVVGQVERMVDAVEIPVVVDADTGYGGPLNVYRTVRMLERAGAAAIQLEDQVEPKRCGHFEGTTVVPTAEMLQRLAAALDARVDPDLMIIARTDGYATEGLDGAIDRAHAYADAGADVIFLEAPTSRADLARLPELVAAPLLANMVEGGRTPLCSAAELAEMGFRCALFANTALRAALFAVDEALRTLRAEGGTTGLLDRIVSWTDRQELLGLARLQEQEARYVAAGERAVGTRRTV